MLGEAIEVSFLDGDEVEGLLIAEAELGGDFVIEVVENLGLGDSTAELICGSRSRRSWSKAALMASTVRQVW